MSLWREVCRGCSRFTEVSGCAHGGCWHELWLCRKAFLMVRGMWVPVSVHRGFSLSDTCWGCDSVFVGVENGHVHPMRQPRFGFPRPNAGRAVLQS